MNKYKIGDIVMHKYDVGVVIEVIQEGVRIAKFGNDDVELIHSSNVTMFDDIVQAQKEDSIEKFEIGESFIYQNGESVELGVVKSIVRDNEYFCNYHTGDTAALTHARNMKKIRNNYAFEIRRKGVNER